MRDRDNRKSTATAFMFFISFHRVYFSSIVRKSGAFHDQREIKKETFLFCASHDCLLPLVTRGSFEIFQNIRNWFLFARLRTLCRIFAWKMLDRSLLISSLIEEFLFQRFYALERSDSRIFSTLINVSRKEE